MRAAAVAVLQVQVVPQAQAVQVAAVMGVLLLTHLLLAQQT
jgi:hypothetical protein